MTAITTPAKNTHTTPVTNDAEQLLRDAAFVLRMVRTVKTELLSERPHAARVAASRTAEPAVLSM